MSTQPQAGAAILEKVLAEGNLEGLTSAERVEYYNAVCASRGLNPLTRPFEFVKLSGKLTMYARRDCADQLRRLDNISVEVVSKEVEDGLFVVHVRARTPDGRTDEDFGTVPFGNLQGEARANAILKAITKAKRRVTLSICGLGMMDESEVESVQAEGQPRRAPVPPARGPVLDADPELPTAPAWEGLAWPICSRDGKCQDFHSEDEWLAEVARRVQTIQARDSLSDDIKRQLVSAVLDANRSVLGVVRDRGHTSAADEAEALFQAALGSSEDGA